MSDIRKSLKKMVDQRKKSDATYVRVRTAADDATLSFDRARDANHGKRRASISQEPEDHTNHNMGWYNFYGDKGRDKALKDEEKVARRATQLRKSFKRKVR